MANKKTTTENTTETETETTTDPIRPDTPITMADLPLSIMVGQNTFMAEAETFVLSEWTLETWVGVLHAGLKKTVHDGAALGEEASHEEKRAGCEKRAEHLRANTHGFGGGSRGTLEVKMRPYVAAYLKDLGLSKNITTALEDIGKRPGACRAIYDRKIGPHFVEANPDVSADDILSQIWTDGIETKGRADMTRVSAPAIGNLKK